MKHLVAIFACVILAAAAGAALVRGARPGPAPPLAAPETPVNGVLYARHFTLAQPYPHTWRAERPLVSSGYLVVLDIEREYLVPRQGLEPVLILGEQTVERINNGDGSGHLVAIVPDAHLLRDADRVEQRDLAERRSFFATPALPEEVDGAWIAAQVERAASLAPLGASAREALAAGTSPVQLEDRVALEHLAAELIMRYAPDESEQAAGMLVPLLR
ncbi:MAG: hypothetical protein QF724_07435 [Planctomycetota bacterium]|nr:hypothetical protein [Planctomycetota bacterium]MDP6838751.1 hypothetical protein [Planctomycetota bacterium]MDP6955303.1 hypothetical protein [Planctomycetota bacterium]